MPKGTYCAGKPEVQPGSTCTASPTAMDVVTESNCDLTLRSLN